MLPAADHCQAAVAPAISKHCHRAQLSAMKQLMRAEAAASRRQALQQISAHLRRADRMSMAAVASRPGHTWQRQHSMQALPDSWPLVWTGRLAVRAHVSSHRAIRCSLGSRSGSRCGAPDVGSSMNSRDGRATSSRPMLTLLRWPPLRLRSFGHPIRLAEHTVHANTALACLMPRCSTEPTMECCTARRRSRCSTSSTTSACAQACCPNVARDRRAQ